MLRVEGLTKSFGENIVLRNIDLTMKQGEIAVIIGESGCGKSVFLRCIEQLEKADSGRIRIDGSEITDKNENINLIRRKIGMVYQQYNLFSHLNVMDNLCLAPVNLLKMSRSDAEAKAARLLREVGMSGRETRMPSELSGGQRQRVAIARCLMMEPKMILMDEPTSALDPGMVCEVLATIRDLAKKRTTMLIVTHEMSFAREIADKIYFFAEQGIYESGTPEEIFDHPRRELTKSFVRKVRSFYYHIDRINYDLIELKAGLRLFCERYGVNSREIWRLEVCMEELVQEIIMKCALPIDIDLLLEYDKTNGDLNISCKWNGPNWDPFAEESDSLGMVILQHIVENAQYVHTEGLNVLNFSLKKGTK